MKYRTISIIAILASVAVLGLPVNRTNATLGSLVASVTFSAGCSSGVGVGIAFDGKDLWYSCYASSTDLYRADVSGTVTASYSIAGGLGALAYDKTNNVIYAGWGGSNTGTVYKLQLDNPNQNVVPKNFVSSVVAFTTGGHPIVCGLDDGLAFDGGDNSIYISDDCSTTIHHYDAATGAHLLDYGGTGDFAWAGSGCYNSGLATSSLGHLYEGSNGCSMVWVVNKASPSVVAFSFSTVVSGDPNFRDEDLECDSVTFPVDVMWSKEAYSPMRAHAFEIPKGSCPFGGGGGGFVSKFFTDTSYNPLPKDANGNPKVDVVLANGVVRSTNPGQIMAWVNVTNTGTTPIQSLVVNETLPMDWTAHPDWLPAKGAIHVFFATNPTTLPPSLEITDPSTIILTGGNPEVVTLSIPSLNATAAGQPLMTGQSILLQVKLDYALAGTSQSASSYPRNATDTASATIWTGANYTGSSSSGSFTGLFVEYAKVVGDASGDNMVNVVDLALTGKAFGSRAGSARFNANADFDYNGIIDIVDLATVGLYFGTSS